MLRFASPRSNRAHFLTLAVVLTLTARSADALPQFQWDEHTAGNLTATQGTFPVDCAAGHNLNRAAVRYANPNSNVTILSIWNLSSAGVSATPMQTFGGTIGGSVLKSGEGTLLSATPLTYQPSDRVELTNSQGVSIGAGGVAMDETYIEVFDVTPPAFRFQYVEPAPALSDPDWASKRAGFAHDLAITRGGEWAVVNSDNWIHVVDLNNDIVHPFNIGLFDYSSPGDPVEWSRPCSPNRAVDSVVVTGERAVVTTARLNPLLNPPAYTTWVYILDLSDASAIPQPSILLQHELAPPSGTEFPTQLGDWPHDIAVTPLTDIEGGSIPLAIVTSMHTVAAFNLASDTFLNSVFELKDRREYQWQVDSVEMTGKAAVVISDRDSGAGLRWQIRMFDADATLGLVAGPIYTAPDEGPLDRAHDLAIEKQLGKGIVRTSKSNVVLQNLTTPPAVPVVLTSPNASDAHGYDQFRLFYGYTAFSSDSVMIGNPHVEEDQTRLMAVSLGSIEIQPGQWEGATDVIDLNAATPVVLQQVRIIPNDQIRGGCVPLDLAIDINQAEVVVRSSDPRSESSLLNEVGADLARITILPTASIGILHQYGGNGSPMGLDSLATPSLTPFVNITKRTLSISQNEFSSPSGVDYTHIAR